MSSPRNQASMNLFYERLVDRIGVGFGVVFSIVTILITSILPSSRLSRVPCGAAEMWYVGAVSIPRPRGRRFKSCPRHQEKDKGSIIAAL